MKLSRESIDLKEIQQHFPEAGCTSDIVYCIQQGSLFKTNRIGCPALNLGNLKQTNLPCGRYFLCTETMFKERIKIKASLNIEYNTWGKYNHSYGIRILFNNKNYFIKIEDLKCFSIDIIF